MDNDGSIDFGEFVALTNRQLKTHLKPRGSAHKPDANAGSSAVRALLM